MHESSEKKHLSMFAVTIKINTDTVSLLGRLAGGRVCVR